MKDFYIVRDRLPNGYNRMWFELLGSTPEDTNLSYKKLTHEDIDDLRDVLCEHIEENIFTTTDDAEEAYEEASSIVGGMSDDEVISEIDKLREGVENV